MLEDSADPAQGRRHRGRFGRRRLTTHIDGEMALSYEAVHLYVAPARSGINGGRFHFSPIGRTRISLIVTAETTIVMIDPQGGDKCVADDAKDQSQDLESRPCRR